jgi:hypothetical protein
LGKSKGGNNLETVFLDDGEQTSTATVATVYKDFVFMGNVMDDHFLVLKKE